MSKGLASEFVVGAPFAVDAAATRRYSRSIGDANEAYEAGAIAHPAFAVVPIVPLVVEARHNVSTGPGLHAEHCLSILAPIRPGMTMTSDARVSFVKATPVGLLMVVSTESRSAADRTLLNRQDFSVLVPDDRRTLSFGSPPTDHRMPAGVTTAPAAAECSYDLDPGLGRRFAEASGDMSSYTFDLEAARARGLPGILVGGICTLSFAITAVVDALAGGQPQRLERIAMRFSRLLLLSPGQRLTVRFWNDDRDPRRSYRFEAYDKEGTAIATHGLARLES